MIKINKISFIFLLCSFLICQDYSLMNIHWEPEFPNKGDDIIIYADVSDAEYFKHSYQMNIHLSVDEKKYSMHAMFRDYSKGLFVWAYKYNINQDVYFQIDNNYRSNEINTHSIKILDYDTILHEANLLLAKQDYQGCIFNLKNIINAYDGKSIAAEAEYMIAEIFLNDFEEYSIAADYYKDIISKYPKGYQEVKKSMFTLAYIYANYLDYYSDAILLYEEFKRTYPDDDLINSIDYELQNLSKFDKEIKSLLNSSK